VGDELALMIVDEFLSTEFEGGRHSDRVKLIGELDEY
jgi:ribose 5-phosphate isomerase B